MHFQTLTIAALVGAVSAAIPKDSKFTLMSLRSASPVHFAQFSATQGSLLLNLDDQDAKCAGKVDPGYATFELKDGSLYLYNANDKAKPQQIFVDRSGMGQGVTGYLSGNEKPPRNAELKGWKLDKNDDLTLAGAPFIACPNSIDGAWSLWVDAGVSNPAGNKGCLGISARAVKATKPHSCHYSS